MKKNLRCVALFLAWLLSLPARMIPFILRRRFVMGLLMIESRIGAPEAALKRLFSIDDDLELIVSERAMALDGGRHPKHRLTGYHQFFIERIKPFDRVLDIGCGPGYVAMSIAHFYPDATVVGVDYDPEKLRLARGLNLPGNLSFLEADATKGVPDGPWNVIVLSNVLEHIVDRPRLLRDLQDAISPEWILIRVPLFERDWRLPMRREVGANYYSDPDHKIEPTVAEFTFEVEEAGLQIVELKTMWGEIWAKCHKA